MSIVIKVFKIITRAFLYISYASITVLAALTVFDVLRRFMFSRTMIGLPEWSQMLLIISMTAMAHAMVEGRFVAVSALVERFPKKINIGLEIVMGLLSFVFFGIVGTQLIGQIDSSILFRETYFMLGVPRWPFYGVLGASFLAMLLSTVVYVYEKIINFKSIGDKDIFEENPDLAILAFSDYADKKDKEAE